MSDPRTGKTRNKPMSFSLPGIANMLDEEGDVVEIRYIPSSPEIVAEHQNISNPDRIYKLIKKPLFTHGVMTVPKSQKNLIRYMDSHPGNEANQKWGFPNQKTIFRKYDAEAEARKANQANRNLTDAMRQVYVADNDKRLAVAKYLNLNYSNVSFMEQDLMGYASQNPERFLELLADPVVMRYSEVDEAEKLGIIKVEPTRILWGDGRQIIVCPQGKDPKRYFAEATFDSGYISTWEEVKRSVSRIKGGKVSEEKVLDPTGDVVAKFKALTTKELFEVAKDKGVVTYKVPNWTFMNYKGKGADGFMEIIDKNPHVRDLLIAAIVDL